MTGYERYMRVLRGEAADVLPRLPILMGWAARYVGADYAAFASDHHVLVEANLRCVQDFGFDQVSAISDPYRETTGFGAEVEYVPDTPPLCLNPPLEETKDLDVLRRPEPWTSPRMRDRMLAIESYHGLVADQYSILGWVEGPAAEAADLRGVTNFMMDLVDDPAFCTALMRVCTDVGITFAVAQVLAGADTIGIGDAIASQMSAAMYESLVFPEEKRLVEGIHAAGGLVRLHICGNIAHLLPSIARLEVDILDVDSMVDMGRVRHTVGARTTLVGNIDPVKGVLDSSPRLIENAVAAAYRQAGNPYMVGAGCEIPIGTPPENLRALCRPVPWAPAPASTT